jgi:iron(III) transport system permease protein
VSAGGRRPPLLLTVPAVATVALLLLPLAYLVVRASEGGGRGFDVLTRDSTLHLLWSTGLLVAGVVVAAVLVAVPLAWLVTCSDLPGRRWWAIAAALPLVIPSYVAALCLLGAFGPRGLAADALGLERLPDIRGYWGALVALTLSTYPYVFLLTAATLRDLDPALEEAARGLGKSRLQVFRRVTVPALRPPVAAGGLLVALYVLSDFGVVSLMRYDALTRAIFLQYRSLFDRTPAAVLGLLLVGLTAVALLLELRARSGRSLYRTAPGAARPAEPAPLGRWKVPALAFCGATVGASSSSFRSRCLRPGSAAGSSAGTCRCPGRRPGAR